MVLVDDILKADDQILKDLVKGEQYDDLKNAPRLDKVKAVTDVLCDMFVSVYQADDPDKLEERWSEFHDALRKYPGLSKGVDYIENNG
jgi:hypothetical protein